MRFSGRTPGVVVGLPVASTDVARGRGGVEGERGIRGAVAGDDGEGPGMTGVGSSAGDGVARMGGAAPGGIAARLLFVTIGPCPVLLGPAPGYNEPLVLGREG